MKAGYKILTHPRPFQMEPQVRVVAALCVLHNILNNFAEEEIDTSSAPGASASAAPAEEIADEDDEHIYNISRAEIDASVTRRHEIASAMWADYVVRRQRMESADI